MTWPSGFAVRVLRRVARASAVMVFVLVAGGCASGSSRAAPTPTALRSLPPVPAGLHSELAQHSGIGPGTVGTFVADGAFQFRFVCVGPGDITEQMSDSTRGAGSGTAPCDGAVHVDGYGSECPGVQVTLTVAVARDARWRFDAISQGPTPSERCPA